VIGGFLKGALTGTIVAGLVAGTASVLTEPPGGDAPQAGTVDVTPGSGFDTRREDRAAILPDPETRPRAVDPPQVTRPAPAGPGEAAPRADPDTAPATAPMTEGADTLGTAPAPEGDSGGIAAERDSPVASGPSPAMPDTPETDQPLSDPQAQPATPAPGADAALRRNAAAFTNPQGKPLMAIVLMEAAGSTVTFETLENFPYPLSIALKPERRGAAEAAARYRDAGFEVLLTVDLARDVAPAETRAALQEHIARVPQAVAVLEGGAGGLPVTGAAPVLAQSGHGLVSRTPEPDPASGLLALAGVPAAPLQRDLDGQWQGVTAIEAALDQAAAAADAQRGVIVLGRMRADTLRALSLWAGQGGARRVALAPVSAVLSARADR
jgi:polysaccharide deacetylase 2 family uncharacterized protein YibQ